MQSTAKAKAAKSAESVKFAALDQREISAVTPSWLLRYAVVVCGASVMVVEILGSRILAPTFGTTLHVWSALITVTLAALALGYSFGGRLADDKPGLRTLMIVIGISAGTLLLSDLLTAPVLRFAYGGGMVIGTFVAAVLLFLPTLFLLGMVSPMAVRAAADQNHLGQSVGNLYALSTVGSVAGSLAVSLLLIPRLNVHTAVILTAVALGSVPLWYLLSGAKKQMGVLLLMGLALGGVATKVLGEDADRTIYYKGRPFPVTAREPSSYGDLVVSDHQGTKYLFLNGVQQGSLRGDNSGARYAYGLERLATVNGVPKNMLVWGLGAGVYARKMAEAGTQVTVLEIDPASEKIAREHFGLPASVKVIIGDARTETLRLNEKYEVIVLDAFSGDTPPFHLLTKEAFESLRTRLAPNGLILANIVGAAQGEGSRVVASVVKTLAATFGNVSVFAPNRKLDARDDPNYVSTMFLVTGALPAQAAAFPLPVPKEMQSYLDSVLTARINDVTQEGAVLLTDAYAPLEAWSDAAVRAMR
ncbi:MAG: fused MFS/spermidine synthase [Acidobacteria bacterium]|nr:fused MFS/spermidine synthase [Acidobacteriota bacterium]MBI3422073.1 fused MFS/spermidine synthase [Acidobacteriota bacterium]